jgi:hypothetical protein
VVSPWLGRDADVGTEECCTEFGNELLAGVSVIAEAFAKLSIGVQLWL